MTRPAHRALTRRRLLAEGAAAAAVVAGLPAWTRGAARRADRGARELRRLAALVRGPVVTASDPSGLAIAAQLYNSRFDGPLPLAVVYALDERDVQATVRWSARTGVRLAARSGGHSYGGYSNPRGGVLLDVTGIRGTGARPRERRAAIGAGSRAERGLHGAGVRRPDDPGGHLPDGRHRRAGARGRGRVRRAPLGHHLGQRPGAADRHRRRARPHGATAAATRTSTGPAAAAEAATSAWSRPS